MKVVLGAILVLLGTTLAADDGRTAYVDLATTRGAGSHNASAFIYGMPLNFNPNQIPDHLYVEPLMRSGSN